MATRKRCTQGHIEERRSPGLLGLGLGGVIRRTAGAVAVLFGLLLVPPILLELLLQAWQTTVGPYLPMQAGGRIFVAQQRGPDDLGACTATGLVLIDRRDA